MSEIKEFDLIRFDKIYILNAIDVGLRTSVRLWAELFMNT